MISIEMIIDGTNARCRGIMAAVLAALFCLGGAAVAQDLDGDGWTVADGDLYDQPSGFCTSPELANPGAYEIPGNGIDDDCDGVIDNTPPLDCSLFPNFDVTDARDLAMAMDICQLTTADPPLPQRTWGLISAQLLRGDGTGNPPHPLQAAVVTGFGDTFVPQANATMAVLSTGSARDADDPGYVAPELGFEDPSNVTPPPADYTAAHGGVLPCFPGCPCLSGGVVYDVAMLRLNIRVPTNADGLSLDLMFLTSQFPDLCSEYNDMVLALLYTGASIPADHNIVYDYDNSPMSTQTAPFVICNSALDPDCYQGYGALTGTGFDPLDDAATGWLADAGFEVMAPVIPGEEITLELVIFDVGDAFYDSTVLLDNFHWRFIPQEGPPAVDEPTIVRVEDVGNDQGRQVRLGFLRSVQDAPGAVTPVLNYELYRRIDELPARGVGEDLPARTTGLWDLVSTRAAHGDSLYFEVVPTLADSTVAHGMHWSVFFVRAATAEPLVYYDSPPDSGWSVDNLAPSAPENLMLANGLLSWDPCPDADFDYFTVYGSATPDPAGATVLGHTTGTSLDVLGATHAYLLVTATDFSGNEGPAAAAETLTGVGSTPAAFRVLGASPNPFNPRTTIRFELPDARAVDLRVYDATGRLVRTLLAGETRPAGRQGADWDGRDGAGRTVPSGVYFYRLSAGEDADLGRMLLLK